MSRPALLSKREKEIVKKVTAILCAELNPDKIILFGSRGKGKFQPHADFDFALEAPKPDLSEERKIVAEIEKVAGLYKVDLVYLPEAEPEFQKIILTTGKMIYEKRN